MATLDMADPAAGEAAGLQRRIGWTGAFWIASGVPALVLTSIGAVGSTVGNPAWIVWTISILMGFVQSFSYAEIGGLFPDKSGGASVYGAIAWVRYGKAFAPVSVWCNWIAWSPVLAIGSGLAAGYILSIVAGPGSPLTSWRWTIADLGWIRAGLSLRIDATFLFGTATLLAAFAIQHRGIGATARVQVLLGVCALAPLLLIATIPLVTGRVDVANLIPLLPIARGGDGAILPGAWDRAGITLFAGGLFVAAWSTYAFETAVCYTREFRDPATDTYKAILYSGLLCIAVFTLVPMTFQGVLGIGRLVTPAVTDAAGTIVRPAIYDGLLNTDIANGMGVGKAMAGMIGAGAVATRIIVAMMILALLLAIITSMAGSSRTLFQASVDGWLPRYLSRVNAQGAPTAAMWTDLGFNLLLLSMSDYVFVLAISNVCYILFNFLNLNATWIHRIDRPDDPRPYRTPTALVAAGTVLSFVNLALLGMGADVWGRGTLVIGLGCAAAIFPVFLWRHYVTDGGIFPGTMTADSTGARARRRAGAWPYLTIAAGVAVIAAAHHVARY